MMMKMALTPIIGYPKKELDSKMKKEIGRKIRKQRRKKKQNPSLSDDVEKNLRRLAKRLTTYRKYPVELQNKRFYCNKCKKVYCFTFIDTIKYCQECIYRDFCAKEVQDIKSCC